MIAVLEHHRFGSSKRAVPRTVNSTVSTSPSLVSVSTAARRSGTARPFPFQIATENQEETDRYWNAIVRNGGVESQCGWCKDRLGLSWQITPRALTDACRGQPLN